MAHIEKTDGTQFIEEFTAEQYFDYVKSKKITAEVTNIQSFRSESIRLLQKFDKTGQIKSMKKLQFLISTTEKEENVINAGLDSYVLLKDIRNFIENVSSDVVKIIELENYPREIPDDIIEKFENVKGYFDKFYIVFTDYTGEEERKIEKDRIEKDPILFGCFFDFNENEPFERFYYIGDWIDEYCDLTLDKLVSELSNVGVNDIVHDVSIPTSTEEILKKLDRYEYVRGRYVLKEIEEENIEDNSSSQETDSQSKIDSEKGFFKKIKSWLSF